MVVLKQPIISFVYKHLETIKCTTLSSWFAVNGNGRIPTPLVPYTYRLLNDNRVTCLLRADEQETRLNLRNYITYEVSFDNIITEVLVILKIITLST